MEEFVALVQSLDNFIRLLVEGSPFIMLAFMVYLIKHLVHRFAHKRIQYPDGTVEYKGFLTRAEISISTAVFSVLMGIAMSFMYFGTLDWIYVFIVPIIFTGIWCIKELRDFFKQKIGIQPKQ